MSAQAPLISIPAKATSEVDLATPVAQLIRSTYGEDAKSHADALNALNRARQDAVRGAGSDATARDLLYKWFHMLEMLELRFPELRVPFPWKDAFTGRPISQHSLAYEKASIIFNIASALSSLAARASRLSSSSAAALSSGGAATAGVASDGLKLSFLSLRQSAGMLTYINDNFLHAPSTDMSKDVVRWLVNLMLAQATEVLWEKTVAEGKGASLTARLAAQAGNAYAGLEADAKEWTSKGVLSKSWAALVACKSKYFLSVAQYYRAQADAASSNHGACLVRLTLAETLAKEAVKLSAAFTSSLSTGAWTSLTSATSVLDSSGSSPPSSPDASTARETTSAAGTLPSDAASMMSALTATHLALVTGRKNVAVKDNDLIYHDILPSQSMLPTIEALAAATPISIQEIYGSADVQKLIGAASAGAAGAGGGASGLVSNDLFNKLVPLGVHEAASMYSEEKAQLARNEAELAQLADTELVAALEYMQLPAALARFRGAGPAGLAQSAVDALADPGAEVRAWAKEEEEGGGSRGADGLGQGGGVDEALRKIAQLSAGAKRTLEETAQELDAESAACEKLRVRFGAAWKMEPSGAATRSMRAEIRSHLEALQQASGNDQRIRAIWNESGENVGVLLGGREALERAFAEAVAQGGSSSASAGAGADLLDLSEADERSNDADVAALKALVEALEGNLNTLHRLKRARAEALVELRSRIQSDDISHLLILNRRAPPEAQQLLFTQELDKFKPLQARLGQSAAEQEQVLADVARGWKQLSELSAARRINEEWERRSARREALVRRLKSAREAHAQARAGAAKALQFYEELQGLVGQLRREARSFVEERNVLREKLRSEAEWEERGRDTGAAASTSPPPPQSRHGLESSFAAMNVGPPPPQHLRQATYPAPPPPPSSHYASPPSVLSPQQTGAYYAASSPAPPPAPSPYSPPPQASHASAASPYDSLSAFESFTSPQAQQQQQQRPAPPAPSLYGAPPTSAPSPYGAPSPYAAQTSHYASSPAPASASAPALPPPPPQWRPSSNAYSAAPPPPAPQQQQSYQNYAQQPPPPQQQRQMSGSYGAPPPPPPQQQQQPGYAASQYGAPPQQLQYGAAQPQQQQQYGAPPPLPHQQQQFAQPQQGYGQPPPPPPQQQQQWRPAY